MEINPGNYAIHLEPDRQSRASEWHKAIMSIAPILGTKSGHNIRLSCGHYVQTFGDLNLLDGVILCVRCRDNAVRASHPS
jgi:hypothetical protein